MLLLLLLLTVRSDTVINRTNGCTNDCRATVVLLSLGTGEENIVKEIFIINLLFLIVEGFILILFIVIIVELFIIIVVVVVVVVVVVMKTFRGS